VKQTWSQMGLTTLVLGTKHGALHPVSLPLAGIGLAGGPGYLDAAFQTCPYLSPGKKTFVSWTTPSSPCARKYMFPLLQAKLPSRIWCCEM
jgi:hypothetical protein